jgi:hypothetical protein
MWIAGCGLVLSILAHVMALAGLAFPGGKLVWALHIGVFVVWFPTVVVLNSMPHVSQKDIWKVAFAGCPRWMRQGAYALFGYAILNFVFFLATTAGESKQPAGDPPPSAIRGFSGHWMIFYAVAFCTLYSRVHAPHLYRERTCPQGHTASPTARYCSECGHEFRMAHEERE